MKKFSPISHSFIFIFIILALVLFSIASMPTSQNAQDPPPVDDLEVGSTTGITLLSFLITGVIVIPLIAKGALKRKKRPPNK